MLETNSFTPNPGIEILHRSFVSYSDEFYDVLGNQPRLEKVIDVDAHEGPVYVPDEDAIYFTT